MTLEQACELAIAFGLLTHSALLVWLSRDLAGWIRALETQELALYRLVERLQQARADDAPPHARLRPEHNGE